MQHLRCEFPQIQHHLILSNRGYSGGVNFAFEKAFEQSKWVFLLTNDTELVQWQWQEPPPGLYSPTVWLRNKNRLDYRGGTFDSARGALQHVPQAAEEKTDSVFPYVPGTAFLLDRGSFLHIGLMDESLHTYWEDVDFGARAAKMGIPMGILPDVEIIHAGGKTNRKKAFYTHYLFRRNRLRVSWRHCPWYKKPMLAVYLSRDADRKSVV